MNDGRPCATGAHTTRTGRIARHEELNRARCTRGRHDEGHVARDGGGEEFGNVSVGGRVGRNARRSDRRRLRPGCAYEGIIGMQKIGIETNIITLF